MRKDGSSSIKLLALAVFSLAAVSLVLAGYFRSVDTQAFAVPLLLLPLLLVFAVWTVLGTAQRLVAGVAVLALCLIDFGVVGLLTPITLGVKGVVYGLCFLVGAQFVLRNIRRLGPVEWMLLAYVLFAWGSAAYSKDAWTSTYTGFALTALALLSIRMAFEAPQQLDRYLTLAGRGLGAALGLSLVFYLVMPQLAISATTAGGGRVGGLFGSPNAAGGVAAVTILVNLAIVLWPPVALRLARPVAFAAIVVALMALQLSGGRNALLSTLMAAGLMVGIRWPRPTLAVLALATVAALAVTAFDAWGRLSDFFISLIARQRGGFDVHNLTGRTEIWAFVIEQWRQSPFVGYGLGGSRTVISEGYASFWGKTTGTAHNAALESLLDLGIVGTVLLAGYLALVTVGAMRRVRTGSGSQPTANVGLGLLVFIFLFGLTEKSFAGTPSTATGAMLLVGSLVGLCFRSVRSAAAGSRKTRFSGDKWARRSVSANQE